MSDDDELTMVGTCGEISEKNGWTSFAINVPGKNYPVRLSTKLPALIEQGRAVGDGIATWTYKESQGGENPNKPGTFYTNRYMEGVVAGATAEAQAASDTPTSTASVSHASTHSALPAGDRERSIIRQTCIKAAAELYSGCPIGANDPDQVGAFSAVPPGAVIEAAARFELWIMRDLDSVPF